MFGLRHLPVVLVLSAGLGLAGCDPAGPGAAGTISTKAIDPSSYQSLVVRAFPDNGQPFDPKNDLPASGMPPDDVQPLKTVSLPYRYTLGGGLGNTDRRDWRLVAWLSKKPSDSELSRIEPGDAFCTVRFALDGCGWQFGGYCDTKARVDCVIDQTAP
jgi:hypothetical protein